jgi:hypothetical protein
LEENLIPLEIVGDFVFETSWGINLPLDEFFLEPIASDLTEILKIEYGIEERNKRIEERKSEIGKRGMKLRKLGLYLARSS